MKSTILLIWLVIGIAVNVSANIIHVPGQYSAIQEGIDNSSDGDTVLVQPDTYVENINFNGHNILLCSMFLPTGDTSYISSTIIDGGSSGSVVTFAFYEDSTAIINGFTIRNGLSGDGGGIYCYNNCNPTISNNIIIGNSAQWYFGGGIACYFYANPTINNNTIRGNTASRGGGGIWCSDSSPIISNNIINGNISNSGGGGVYCIYNSNPKIINNTIIENSADTLGGGIYCNLSSPTIINNTISENSAGTGGGICLIYVSIPIIINTICWGDSADYAPEIWADTSSSPILTYCDIQDTLWPGEGNISADPLFRDPENEDYHIMATYCGDPFDSPCIDAGCPTIIDTLLDCDWGLGEMRSDIGAYAGGDSTVVGIPEHQGNTPKSFYFCQNYPNPFNASTTIRYQLPVESDVNLIIYNLLGQRVETLIDEYQDAGYKSITWDASSYSSGIYFYKLTTGDITFTKRMTLLK